jgi:hypothetical protein
MEAITAEKWKDLGLLYVNYKYHKDVCAMSIKRLETLREVKELLCKRVDPAKILKAIGDT